MRLVFWKGQGSEWQRIDRGSDREGLPSHSSGGQFCKKEDHKNSQVYEMLTETHAPVLRFLLRLIGHTDGRRDANEKGERYQRRIIQSGCE